MARPGQPQLHGCIAVRESENEPCAEGHTSMCPLVSSSEEFNVSPKHQAAHESLAATNLRRVATAAKKWPKINVDKRIVIEVL